MSTPEQGVAVQERISQVVVFGAMMALASSAQAEDGNAAPRPETLAIIKVLHGTVITTTGQGEAPAQLEQELVGTDRIDVAAESWTVVRLKNGYYVRLDDEISIAVNQIALINIDRVPEASDEDQLRHLLGEEEYRTEWQQARGERLAGWFVRRTVGEAQPVQPATETPPPPPSPAAEAAPRPENKEQGAIARFFAKLFGSKQEAPSAPSASAFEPPAAPAFEPPAAPKSDQVATVQPVTPSKDEVAPKKSPVEKTVERPADHEVKAPGVSRQEPTRQKVAVPARPAVATRQAPPSKERRAAAADQPRELPAHWISKLGKHAQLKACVKNSVEAMDLGLSQVELRVKVVAGKIVKVGLGNGLRPPECAAKLDFKNLKQDKKHPVADGWYAIPFTIKN